MTRQVETVEELLAGFEDGKDIYVEDYELLVKLTELLNMQGHRTLHVILLHDNDCDPRKGCSCKPHYVIQKMTAENVLEGHRAEREYFRQKDAN